MTREPTEAERLVFAFGHVNRLALLALFDAMAEMLGADSDEFRMRFIRHLDGRVSPQHPETRLLADLAEQVRAERSAGTTGGTAPTRPS